MSHSSHIAKHMQDVFFGGNWTSSNLRDQLEGLTLQEATTQVLGLNSIATLTCHIAYYITEISKVLDGAPLTSKDEHSFKVPPLNTQEDWNRLVKAVLLVAEKFSAQIAALPEERIWEPFTDAKYGDYYRNLNGIIEHTHYHLGQIAMMRKIVRSKGVDLSR